MWNLFGNRMQRYIDKNYQSPKKIISPDSLDDMPYLVKICNHCKKWSEPCRFKEGDEVVFFNSAMQFQSYQRSMAMDEAWKDQRKPFVVATVAPNKYGENLFGDMKCSECKQNITQYGWVLTLSLKDNPEHTILWEIDNTSKHLFLISELSEQKKELLHKDRNFNLEFKIYSEPRSTQYSVMWRSDHPDHKEWTVLKNDHPHLFDYIGDAEEAIKEVLTRTHIYEVTKFVKDFLPTAGTAGHLVAHIPMSTRVQ